MDETLNGGNTSFETTVSKQATEQPNKDAAIPPSNYSRSRALGWFTFLLLVIGFTWFCYWYFYLQYRESTDDAYADGNLININSVISGAVIAYYADNTDLVKKGQLLVELDRTNYQAIYNKELATLASVALTVPESHPLIEQQKENIRTAFYHLQHCSIYTPQTGYIAQRTVDVGNWITPTTNLMAVIPTDYVWVNANYKETQLRKMRIGQPAVVWFDLYGSKVKYEGKVIGIASGTGSVFSLIPPQNATGNWIKIVQRLSVRISLDRETTEKFPVRLGISAEVDVDITNQNLPLLSLSPPEKPVAKTDVFDIHMKELNQIMDKIIRDNLKQE